MNYNILIGAVIAMGSADRDGRLHPGDELVYVDGIPVAGKTHRYVIDLMHHAARNGQVNLTVRRKVLCGEDTGFFIDAQETEHIHYERYKKSIPERQSCDQFSSVNGPEQALEELRSLLNFLILNISPRSDYATYTNSNHAAPSSNASPPEGFASHSLQTSDVVIHRKENEGFGFVIISSLNRPESGSTITLTNSEVKTTEALNLSEYVQNPNYIHLKVSNGGSRSIGGQASSAEMPLLRLQARITWQ
ncbi:Membrane-associated guanylate kinase, WW and PDZ domain-containing protein 2 [Saguinus oedipus]|uniref:Membrane-associated guanylate kinase, WW and PDZ domain-containing protein 2 n=1 Tax=Saguinus oedipus TaxID=9490 RepID=A0ABQ9UI16_SAGOE|nr:Membrane-associated guanylate kinase, WW and PDZ domain-containing protein 2 [Saguinus oedipus]